MAEGYKNMQGMTPPNYDNYQDISFTNWQWITASNNGYVIFSVRNFTNDVQITFRKSDNTDSYMDYYSPSHFSNNKVTVTDTFPIKNGTQFRVGHSGTDPDNLIHVGFIPCSE